MTDGSNEAPELIVQPAARLTIFMIVAVLAFLAAEFVWLVQLRREQFVSRDDLDLAWRISVVIGAIPILFVFFWRRLTAIILTRSHLTKSSGLLVRRYSRIELSRITNSSARRSLFSMLMGLTDFAIDTPGGQDKNEVSMRFVSVDKARELMARINEFKADGISAAAGNER